MVVFPWEKMTKKTFPVVGMHCASCAKLIERSLSKVPGIIKASVNYGSESATVEINDRVTDQELEKAVKDAGYKALLDQNSNVKDQNVEEIKTNELKKLKTKVIISSILSILVFIGSFPEWFSYSLISNPYFLLFLATPVQFWAGKDFYLATWSGLKNRTASMDTLIVIGTSMFSIFRSNIISFSFISISFVNFLIFIGSII